MWRGKGSMYDVFEKKYPKLKIEDYLSFHYLRNYGFCFDGRPVCFKLKKIKKIKKIKIKLIK
jgi:hypothetical protein